MRSRLEVDPVEAGVDGEAREQPVLGAVSVARRQVDGSSLQVERVGGGVEERSGRVEPGLGDSQSDALPLVHHQH